MVFIALLPYITCPVYEYPETTVFKGDKFYNPYAGIDTSKWLKANFHAHSRVWAGLTNGHKSEANELKNIYTSCGYDIIGISDYFKINSVSSIPVYEHGAGIFKNHQLSIGAKNVMFKDYLFWQTFHNKQNIIEELNNGENIISINHPVLRDAYSSQDLINLNGYRLLEIVNNNYAKNIDLWDSVLSAGKMVFLILNDDTHDITNPVDFGYAFTMLNCSNDTKSIIDALGKGAVVGVDLQPGAKTDPAAKTEQGKMAPMPVSCTVINDSLKITFNKICSKLKLVGQNGIVKMEADSVSAISYRFTPADTYIRAEIHQPDGTDVYLNPIFRYNDLNEFNKSPVVNIKMTWILRAVYFAAVIILFMLYLKIRRSKRVRLN